MKIDDLKETLNDEKQITENGALGYKTTGKELLDLNFALSSLRNMSEDEIYDRFLRAFYEDKLLAIKWLFFARDIRGGCGERRTFRVILNRLAKDQTELVANLLPIVSEYGRYDDIWALLDTDLFTEVVSVISEVLVSDLSNMKLEKQITLLGKWLPSVYSRNVDKRRWAKIIYTTLGITKKQYSIVLKALRDYLNVVECKMSRGEWGEINYEAVPSKANVLYRNAFFKHDEKRRKEYLNSLEKGETKINSAANFPHDIMTAYMNGTLRVKPLDATLEALWKALPNYVNGDESTIVVADGSGSMFTTIGGTSTRCIDVANALAIYFAERCSGEYKDHYITFSGRPQLVDLSKGETLREKLQIALQHDECSNTNIYKVFKLILDTAVKHGYSQEQMPKNVLVLSDMEFDYMTTGDVDKTLFEQIAEEYAKYGYKLPRLIFWNLMSRTGTIPVKENEAGVALVSGFSVNIMNMVLSGELDPYKCLVNQLNVPRYDLVEEAFNKSNKK